MTPAGAQPSASVTPGSRPQGRRMARRISRPLDARLSPAALRGSLPAASRRLGMGLGIAALVLVAGVGTFVGSAAGHGGASDPALSAAPAAAVSNAWGSGSSVAQIDLFDLAWKGLLVLALLFVTLRVLARVQGAGQPRKGNLNVLESKQLASKASLHLVAVGERRLVVGLTPAGMVALAELDAEELPADEAAGAETALSMPAAQSPLGSLLGPAIRPIDSFAAKLAAAVRHEQAK